MRRAGILAALIFAILIYAHSAYAQELTLSVSTNKTDYMTTDNLVINAQTNLEMNYPSDYCVYTFHLTNGHTYSENKNCGTWEVGNIRDFFYNAKWIDSNNSLVRPDLPDVLDIWKLHVKAFRAGESAIGDAIFTVKSPNEIQICNPSSFNPDTGEISCGNWVDASNELNMVDNISITITPSTVIRAKLYGGAENKLSIATPVGANFLFGDVFAAGVAIQGRSIISVRADTDGDGIFEENDPLLAGKKASGLTKIDEDPGRDGFRDVIAPYRFYAKFPSMDKSKTLLFYITQGEISVDYLGSDTITETCPRRFDSGVLLQHKIAGLAGSTLVYQLNVTNNDHPTCSPVKYYNNDWIKLNYDITYMGDLKTAGTDEIIIPPESSEIVNMSIISSPAIKPGEHWFKTYPKAVNGLGGGATLHYPTLAAVFWVVEKLPVCGNSECEPGEDLSNCKTDCGCNEGYVLSNETGKCIKETRPAEPSPAGTASFDYGKILETGVRLGSLKAKFISLSATTSQIANYYNSQGIADKAGQWQNISSKFMSLSEDVAGIANYMEANRDNLNENALANARSMIIDIESKLKDLVALVLKAVK